MITEDEFVRNGVVYFPQAVEAVEHYAAILNERLKNEIEQFRPPEVWPSSARSSHGVRSKALVGSLAK